MVSDLDPTAFRQPRGSAATRYLYIAKCGLGLGYTYDGVLATLQEAAPTGALQSLHVGEAGVSYAGFTSEAAAEEAKKELASKTQWIMKFADHKDDVAAPPPRKLPTSADSTAHVEVPGMTLIPDFLTEAEASSLMEVIDRQPWDKSIKRRVQHYGHAFDYSTLALGQGTTFDRPALPDFTLGVVQKLADQGCGVQQITVNDYPPGIGIGFHCDAHSAFGDYVASLSLGSGIMMEFRKPLDEAVSAGKVSVGKYHRLAPPPENAAEDMITKNVWLPANSLLILRGEARYAWQHGIQWRKTDCIKEGDYIPRNRRVSMTFREAHFGPCECTWPMYCDSQNPEAHVLPSRIPAVPVQEPSCGGYELQQEAPVAAAARPANSAVAVS
eukprot:TRINITY_DN19744_c0_g1_i1.p1 TRINITY_DN19744_c0_g1~~TRINITY_DN19744_c0_g1_i1.p1  ORF type:complete len:384 (-),score=67.19 TRINITY_DN19744_c0_g1_i1:12-1163(-)